jgi:RHS repeat-associated protein
MVMPGRQAGKLGRFGFNGKEQDSEAKGTGAQYDYGYRIYDPRVARFLSVDPLFKSYPWFTPYQFAGNMPINSIDMDGLENREMIYDVDINSRGEAKISVTAFDYGKYGGVGPRGRGILVKYNVTRRTSEKVKLNGRIVRMELPTSYQVTEAFIPEQIKSRKGLFQVINEWFQQLSRKEGEQAGGIVFTKPLEEGAHSAGGDQNSPSARSADVIEDAESLIGMIGGFGGEKGLIRSIQNGHGAEKLASFLEALGGAIEAVEKFGEAVELAKEKTIPDPNTVHCLTCSQMGKGNFLLDANGNLSRTESDKPASDTVDHHESPSTKGINTDQNNTSRKKPNR